MSGTEYKCMVVFSVCGHSMQLEGPNSQVGSVQIGVGQRISLDFAQVAFPEGTECRAGWCPTCTAYYQPLDIENETVIDNYWRFKAQQRWTLPVYPSQVPRSALLSLHAGTLVRAAVLDVAACLDSLFGEFHSKLAKEISFLHKCGPRYIEVADLIRGQTLQWARRMEYLNKPLPPISKPKKQEQYQKPVTSASATTERHGKKKKPTPFLDPGKHHRYLTYVDENGDILWIPGAHRTPTHVSSSPPPRTSQSLSWCGYHGRVSASRVDMTCERCKVIFLDESPVSPWSRLVKYHSAPAFSPDVYTYAAEGKCSCRVLKSEVCSPCKARAQIYERLELEFDFL